MTLVVNSHHFKCSLCPYTCAQRRSLQVHERSVHTGERPFECPFESQGCFYKAVSARNVQRHVTAAHTTLERNFKCPHCPYAATQMSYLRIHWMTHRGEKPFKCVLCSYAASQKPHLVAHIRVHHAQEKEFKCKLCPYETKAVKSLEQHIRTHTGEKPYKCSVEGCTYSCKTSGGLKTHQVTHTKLRQFSCQFCEYKAALPATLKLHLRLRHPDPAHENDTDGSISRPFPCHLCSYRSKLKSQLKMHMVVHTTEKKFPCSKCDYQAKTSSALNTHLKTHLQNDQKKFSCSECSFRTNELRSLRNHVSCHHTTDRPFSCSHDNCSYRGPTKRALGQHELIHKLEKDFKCPLCDYETYQKCKLTRHIRIHAKERPEKCDKCRFTCSSLKILKNHQLKIHSGQQRRHIRMNRASVDHTEKINQVKSVGVLQCHLCPMSFWQEKLMVQHNSQVHELPKVILERIFN